MIIRKAAKEDLYSITELAKKMVDYHQSLDSYYKSSGAYKNLEIELEKELGDKNSLFLVAEENSRKVGYLRGAIEPAPAYAAPKKIGVVYDIFVEESYRNKKIGEKLMREALDWFKSRGVKNIELSVDARNTQAIRFWKKFGFFEYKLRMRRDLDPVRSRPPLGGRSHPSADGGDF